jgi:hypothetical protein
VLPTCWQGEGTFDTTGPSVVALILSMGALKQAYRRIGTGAFQLRLTRRTGMVSDRFLTTVNCPSTVLPITVLPITEG